MSNRKFYRTVIQIEVLSDEPYSYGDLADVHYSVAERQCSARCPTMLNNEEIDGKRMAELLKAQGNEPSFFKLDAEGNDTEPGGLELSRSAAPQHRRGDRDP